MKIAYVENKNGKLFSFYTHDYKDNEDNEGNYVMIDGGFDYYRYSGELKEDEIKDLMSDIREQFTWGQNYDENNKRIYLSKAEVKLWLASKEGKDFKKEEPIQYDEIKKGKRFIPKTEYVLLKDLTTSHISGILRYFTERLSPEISIPKNWIAIHLIFCYELENRLKQ